jgi:hypothetical protein
VLKVLGRKPLLDQLLRHRVVVVDQVELLNRRAAEDLYQVQDMVARDMRMVL